MKLTKQMIAGAVAAVGTPVAALTLTANTQVAIAPGAVVPQPPQVPTELTTSIRELKQTAAWVSNASPASQKSLEDLRALQSRASVLGEQADQFGDQVESMRKQQERLGSIDPISWVNPFNASVQGFKRTYVEPLNVVEREANTLESMAEDAETTFRAEADDKDPVVLQRRAEEAERKLREQTQCQLLKSGPGCVDGSYIGF
jgi:hypothetical protein